VAIADRFVKRLSQIEPTGSELEKLATHRSSVASARGPSDHEQATAPSQSLQVAKLPLRLPPVANRARPAAATPIPIE